MEILGYRIKDQRFLDLIRKALNAGYMEFTVYKPLLIGTPQGSIISPLLCNIYMDEFYKFMERLIEEMSIGTTPTRNPVYQNLQYRKRIAKTVQEKQKIHKVLMQTPSKLDCDPKFKKITYVRYADD